MGASRATKETLVADLCNQLQVLHKFLQDSPKSCRLFSAFPGVIPLKPFFLRSAFQTTQTLIRTVTTDYYCYVTKNYGPKKEQKGPVKGILGGLPLIGPIKGQKKQTGQCGKASSVGSNPTPF